MLSVLKTMYSPQLGLHERVHHLPSAAHVRINDRRAVSGRLAGQHCSLLHLTFQGFLGRSVGQWRKECVGVWKSERQEPVGRERKGVLPALAHAPVLRFPQRCYHGLQLLLSTSLLLNQGAREGCLHSQLCALTVPSSSLRGALSVALLEDGSLTGGARRVRGGVRGRLQVHPTSQQWRRRAPCQWRHSSTHAD